MVVERSSRDLEALRAAVKDLPGRGGIARGLGRSYGDPAQNGGGAVLDAENRRRMRERGFVVYLRAGLESQLKRLQRDRTRPLLQRADREDVLRELARAREPLYREVADLVMDTDGLTAAEAATRLGLQLATRWTTGGVAA